MSNLDTDQLTAITALVNARRAEFDIEDCPPVLEPLTAGDVRMVLDVADLYRAELWRGRPGTWGLEFDPETGRLRERTPWEGTFEKFNGVPATPAAQSIPVTDESEGEPPPTHPPNDPENITRVGERAAEVRRELAAHWPNLNDIPEGRDVFAQYPIAGAPDDPQNNAEKYNDPPVSPTESAPAGSPPKSDEKLTHAAPPPKRDEKSTATPAHPHAPAVPRQGTRDVKPLQTRQADPVVNQIATPAVELSKINKPRTLDEADREAAARATEIDAVVASLQAMAVDGEMPTVAKWEAERVGDLPSWKTLARVHGLAWVDLARKAGLRYARQGSLESEVKAAREKAAEKGHERLVTYEMLVAEIKRIAMGKAMPTQAQFDQSKPALWPSASALVMRLETSWADLADVLDLDLQRGRRRVSTAN